MAMDFDVAYYYDGEECESDWADTLEEAWKFGGEYMRGARTLDDYRRSGYVVFPMIQIVPGDGVRGFAVTIFGNVPNWMELMHGESFCAE